MGKFDCAESEKEEAQNSCKWVEKEGVSASRGRLLTSSGSTEGVIGVT